MRNSRAITFTLLALAPLAACGGGGGDTPDGTTGPRCGDGTRDTGEECDDGNTTPGDGCDATCQSEVPPTALRIGTMEIRDPHFFALSGAVDVTSNVNDAISAGLTMDASTPADGKLDLSLVLVFRPLDPAAATSPVDAVAGAACTAPVATTTCAYDPAATVVNTTGTNGDATCLAPAAGTTGGYSPPVGTPSGRCFVTDKRPVDLSLGTVSLSLQDAQIAATYGSGGTASLTNGLMTGFMSKAMADATILPADLPVVGGMPLSNLLLQDDQDTGPGGVDGWWFYMNFTAGEVDYTE